MNWFKKATTIMGLDYKTAYEDLLKELGRRPTTEEIFERMYSTSTEDIEEEPNIPF